MTEKPAASEDSERAEERGDYTQPAEEHGGGRKTLKRASLSFEEFVVVSEEDAGMYTHSYLECTCTTFNGVDLHCVLGRHCLEAVVPF